MFSLDKSKLTAKELLNDICDSLDDSISTVDVKIKRKDGTMHQVLTQNIKKLTNYMREYYKDKI